MRFWQLLAALFACLTLLGSVSVSQATDDYEKTCENENGDDAIAACTRAINSGRWHGPDIVWAYQHRGNIYSDKGDYDRAIADYNTAIRLNPKSAFSYHDRGNAYRKRGDYDRAIVDETEAIKLNPKYYNAYMGRAIAYFEKADYDRAIADYSQAIKLDAKNVSPVINLCNVYDVVGHYDLAIETCNNAIRLCQQDLCSEYGKISAYSQRGTAYRNKGDYDRAIADYSEVIRLSPKSYDAYLSRGLLNLYAGNAPKALADLNQAGAINPKSAYAALWLDIVGRRSNIPSRLTEATAAIDMAAWPAPVIRMFLGQMPLAAVLAAADDPDASKKKGQLCEANLYGGEWALQQSAKDEAISSFRLAATDCPKISFERSAANSELAALGAANSTGK